MEESQKTKKTTAETKEKPVKEEKPVKAKEKTAKTKEELIFDTEKSLKAIMLQKLKEYKFSEKVQIKRPDLIEAIKNANEDVSILLHKTTAITQRGRIVMDATIEGFHWDESAKCSTMTRTVNVEITSASGLYCISGDSSIVGAKNDLSDKGRTKTLYNLLDSYGRDYMKKLNLTYSSSDGSRRSHINSWTFVPEEEECEITQWKACFVYQDKKGKYKEIYIGKATQTELEKEPTISFTPTVNFVSVWGVLGKIFAGLVAAGIIGVFAYFLINA